MTLSGGEKDIPCGVKRPQERGVVGLKENEKVMPMLNMNTRQNGGFLSFYFHNLWIEWIYWRYIYVWALELIYLYIANALQITLH